MTAKQFNALSVTGKRIAVARDVIRSLKRNFYRATNRVYLQYTPLAGKQIFRSEDVKENLCNLKYCKVCAVGSAVMSITKYKNKLAFDEVMSIDNSDHDNAYGMLTKIFSDKQVAMMECAFEKSMDVGLHGFNSPASDKDLERCIKFGKSYKNPNDRLIAIMNNIIRNKGTFKP